MKDEYLHKIRVPMIITVCLLIVGSILYLYLGIGDVKNGMDKNTAQEPQMPTSVDKSLYESVRIKTAYTDDGKIKLFALASYNELARIKALIGKPIPESGQIVIGYDEARIMMDEDMFAGEGDTISDLFGISPKVGGILDETGTFVDELHFLSEKDFDRLEGEEGKAFVEIGTDGISKLFLTYNYGEAIPMNYTFEQGSMQDYNSHDLAGTRYYPIIIGAKEADVMKAEGVFSQPGDIIKDFFGKNFLVIGVLDETGTALDSMHILPLTSGNLEV